MPIYAPPDQGLSLRTPLWGLQPLVLLAAFAAILVTGGMTAPMHALAQERPPILTPDLREKAMVPPASFAQRERMVLVNLSVLASAARQPTGTLRLNLFEDVVVTARRVRWVERGPGRYHWYGHPVNGGGEVSLTVHDGRLNGRIVSNGRVFTIEMTRNGRQRVVEVDPSAEPGCGVNHDQNVRSEGHGPKTSETGLWEDFEIPDGTYNLDVVIGYTPAYLDSLGSVESAEAMAQSIVDLSNTALVNTDLAAQFRLKGVVPYPLVEEEAFQDAIRILRSSEFRELRGEYQADLFLLLTGSLYSAARDREICGSGLFPESRANDDLVVPRFQVSLVRYRCELGTGFVPAHEWGHNLGLAHDVYALNACPECGGTPSFFSYGTGHVNPDSTNPFRTIMAYPDACLAEGFFCPGIAYFSNLLFERDGAPMGTPPATGVLSADNRRALGPTIPVIASLYGLALDSDSFSVVVNEIYPVPVGDANGDGTVGAGDIFVELLNTGTSEVDLFGYQLFSNSEEGHAGSFTLLHTFSEGTVLRPGQAVTVFGGGTPTGIPGLVEVASEDYFRLKWFSPARLRLGATGRLPIQGYRGGVPVHETIYHYGSSTTGQSLTRSPDGTGPLVPHAEAEGADGRPFSPGRTLRGDPLPVELASFAGTPSGDRVRLDWTTASETDNAGFEVQHRSLIGEPDTSSVSWTVLGFVSGAGTTTEAQTYTFTTGALPVGPHAFRLRQVDLDGTQQFVGHVQVHLRSRVPVATSVYPNPIHTAATLAVTLQEAQEVRVAVYDLLGRRVRDLTPIPVSADETTRFAVDATDLTAGVYVVQVEGATFRRLHKVVVVR